MTTKAKRWRWQKDGTAQRGPVLLEVGPIPFGGDGFAWRVFARVDGEWERLAASFGCATEDEARRAVERCADAFVARMLRAFGGGR